jgi:tetratricopeptide (TPR) repeat protein
MASRAHPPRVPLRRRVSAGLRTHWRGLTGILLLGIGTPITIAGGWASKGDRLWWLLAAAACAVAAGVLQLDFSRSESEPVSQIRVGAGSMADDKARIWNIPAPVRTFIGRDPLLTAIRDQLLAEDVVALLPTAALHGMGGIGKTQLARAYAHRYSNHYQLGWWISAETESTITTALGELGTLLGAPSQLPPRQLVVRLQQVLAEREAWLLVFDNAEDPAIVEPFLPQAGKGHVLLTSRNPAWQGVANPIGVDLLALPAAARLLQQRTGDPDRQAAEILAEELGRLPLALEQAAAYIGAQHLSIGRYFELYRARHAELLSRGVPVGYPDTVDATFSLTLDRLRQQDPAAVQLLEVCAVLAPDRLPILLLLSVPECLPDPLATAARDLLQAQETVGTLYQASLLIPDVRDTARIHRLVQVVTRQHLAIADRDSRLDEAVAVLAALFPRDAWEPSRWPRCELVLPHAQAVLDHADQGQHATADVAVLLTLVATYLRARGLHRRAREPDEKALAIRCRLHSGDHPAIAESLSNLGHDLQHTIELRQPLELHAQGLAMRQRLYHGDHPEIAQSLRWVANDLRDLGELEQARELHEQVLAMSLRLYDRDHVDLATSLHLLGIDLRLLGELERARELHMQALAMRQRLYDGDHPAVAGTLYHLAYDLRELGELRRAQELDEQALAMRQRLFGHDVDVVDVAYSLRGLAADLRLLGEVRRARHLDEQALAMFERIYEGDHVDIVRSLNRLAIDFREVGESERARELEADAAAMQGRLAARQSRPEL